MDTGAVPDGVAVLCDVGRKEVRFALTDARGRFRADSVRSYDARTQTTISGALGTFRRDAGLSRLPRRCALAIAGLARGETMSITNSRWFISRGGLEAMLQHPPVIVNDFAAQAWALSAAPRDAIEAIHGSAPDPADKPGTYLVLGMTSGLGVAVLVRQPHGQAAVLATEAGHSRFLPTNDELAAVIAASDLPVTVTEHVVSSCGLVAIYRGLRKLAGDATTLSQPEEITQAAGHDRLAARACELLVEAFWAFTGDAVLHYGAWDGVLVTGKLAAALRPLLRRSDLAEAFHVKGSYTRLLRTTPRAFASVAHAELAGAAEALIHLQPLTPAPTWLAA